MRRASGTKISLGYCSCFFVRAQSVASCSGSSHGTMVVKAPCFFSFFWMELLVSASAGATPPLYGIVPGLSGWNSGVYGGYDVDIYLIGSPHTRCFVALFSPLFGAFGQLYGCCQAQWGPPVVLIVSLSAISISSTPSSISRFGGKIFTSRSQPYQPDYAFFLNPQPPKRCRRGVAELRFPPRSLNLEISIFCLCYF